MNIRRFASRMILRPVVLAVLFAFAPSSSPALTSGSPSASFSLQDGIPTFLLGSQPLARLVRPTGKTVALYQMNRDNRNLPIVVQASAVDRAAAAVSYGGMNWAVADKVSTLGPGLFAVERTWKNLTGKEQEAVLVCEMERLGEVSFFMIPGISYNGNRRWPKARFQGLRVASMSPQEAAESISGAQWVVAGDRSTVPACTITESGAAVVGLYADPKDAGFSACSLEEAAGGMMQRIWWPHQEQPFTITGSGRSVQAPWETVFLRPGDTVRRTFYVAVAPVAVPRTGYGAVLDGAWAQFRRPVKPRHTPRQLWELGMRFAKESLWAESPEFTGFHFSLEPKDGGFPKASWPWRFEIGFVGQAGALGAFMLQDFLWSGNEDSWRKGELSLDFWAKNGKLPNGLIYPRFDDKLAWKTDPDVDTRNMGDAAYFYLLASELAEKAKRPKPLWRETGLGICDFFVAHALPNGRFGKKWKAEGVVTDPEGTIGAYLLPALIKAYRLTKKDAYLRTAERAFRAYADDDLEAVCLAGGAIDADTIDKETGYPLLDAGLDLHEITRDPYYLRMAEKAALYLSSWQYHYGLDMPPGSPGAQIGYEAFGGTTVAVGGGGADQGGAVIALGWLRLAKATGREIWKERALATWAHTTIGISDGTLELLGKVLPAGGQNEGYSHTRTRSSFTSRLGHGNEWLCAWCTAFRLWTLQHWPEWKDLEW